MEKRLTAKALHGAEKHSTARALHGSESHRIAEAWQAKDRIVLRSKGKESPDYELRRQSEEWIG